MAKPACPPPTMTVSILRMSIFLTLCRSIARRQSLPPRTHTRPSSKANWPLLVFIVGKLLGERSFWVVWIDPQTKRSAFRGRRRLGGVVRFEPTEYHTVAATDDRPD